MPRFLIVALSASPNKPISITLSVCTQVKFWFFRKMSWWIAKKEHGFMIGGKI
jgi:hypothetical protein